MAIDIKNMTIREDGLYVQFFAVKDGVRFDKEPIKLVDLLKTFSEANADAVEKLWCD